MSYSRNIYAVQEQNVLAPNLLHASTHFGDATNVSVICSGKLSSFFLPLACWGMLLVLTRKIIGLMSKIILLFFFPCVWTPCCWSWVLRREEAALRPGELTRETAPWDAFFEAASEHQWEETAVAAQPLPVHPSHDLPTLFCCCGSSLQGSLCQIHSAAPFVGGSRSCTSPETFPWGALGLWEGEQRSCQAPNWARRELF